MCFSGNVLKIYSNAKTEEYNSHKNKMSLSGGNTDGWAERHEEGNCFF